MGVLKLLGRLLPASTLLLSSACYEPQLPSCVVRCATGDECPPGQTCTGGYCAEPQLACTVLVPPDGGAPDGGRPDARPPDAGSKVQLRTRISGDGKIQVDGVGTCDAKGPGNGDCMFSVASGVPLTLRAIPSGGHEFQEWTTTTCEKAGATCTFKPVQPITEVRARFRREE